MENIQVAFGIDENDSFVAALNRLHNTWRAKADRFRSRSRSRKLDLRVLRVLLGNDGMVFIDFEQPRRLRVNGRASVAAHDPLFAAFEGAQLVVRVRAERIFPNCPRYIHRMSVAEHSPYVPRAGYTPPVPKWKSFDMLRDVLPRE